MNTDIAKDCSWLAEQWSDGLADVVATLTSTRPAVEFRLAPSPATLSGGDGDIQDLRWWSQGFDALPNPAVWVGARPASYASLSRAILESLGMDAPGQEDIDSTWQDLLAQAGNVLAQRIGDKRQTPLTCGPLQDSPAPGAAVRASATIRMAGGEPTDVEVGFSSQLLDFVSPPRDAPAPPPEPVELRHGALDIQLKMVVTLGRTTLSLGDIFRLSTGSIIEFPQSITQHAEVLINDRLVGRGQVVVLNGNYAVQLASTTFANPGGSL